MKFLSQINVNTEYTLPIVDGVNGQVLATDGNGTAYWGSISAGATNLNALTDVVISSPSSGQLLRYGIPLGSEDPNPVWYNWSHNFLTTGSSIDALGDVTISSAASGQVLTWSGSAWVNATITTAGYVSKVQHEVKAGVAITKGQAVYVTGADGTNMIVGLASNTSEGTSSKTMGIALSTAAVNGKFFAVTEGLIDGLNTASANAGDPVWLGTNGNLIFGLLNKPTSPAHLVYLGVVTRANQNNGEIFVKVQNGVEIDEIHDVQISSPATGQLLRRDTDGYWKNWTPNFLTSLPAHTHDDRYYTESEIDAFFGGELEIAGYNATNWDTAYGWGNHATVGYLTSIPTPINGDWWNGGAVVVATDGVMEMGKYMDFHTSDSGGNADFDLRVTVSPGIFSVGGDVYATGGNSTQWNAAYNDKINSASFNTSNGVLTLTQQDAGTITVDLDGRYLTSETDAQTLTWTKATSSISISNGNSVTLEGLATEEYVTSQGYLTSLPAHNHDDRYYTESESDSRFVNASGDTMNGSLSFDAAAVIKKRITGVGDNPVKTASGVLASRSDNGSGYTYYVIETNVPQDDYQMGGFTIELFGRYGETNNKTKIDLGGYWNAEGNGGFTGFEAHGTNPQYKPTIEVSRNSSGKTAFIIYGVSWAYPVIVARDLWLGYSQTDGSTYGEGWTIRGTNDVSSYTNKDTVVWRNAYSDSNPAGYITGYTETDTLASVTGRGASTGSLVVLFGKVSLGNNSSGTYNGNVAGLTLNSTAEIRSTSAQNPPALTWHYEGLATRHLLMTSAGAMNFVSPSNENSGVAVLQVNGNNVWHAGNFSQTNVNNWNTAYGWGNHAVYGYWNINDTDTKSVQSILVRFVGDVEVQGTFTESSSIRFKENIKPLEPALGKVEQLNPVTYNKIGVVEEEIGLIAEEVAELFPEVVTYNEEGQPQGIQYQRLSVILLKAVQELTERVNKLENK